MEINIISEKINNLLNRKELKLLINYKGSTPSRIDIRKKISAMFNSDFDVTIIDSIKSIFGEEKAECIAKIYSTRDRLEKIEPNHIKIKNKKNEDLLKQEIEESNNSDQ